MQLLILSDYYSYIKKYYETSNVILLDNDKNREVMEKEGITSKRVLNMLNITNISSIQARKKDMFNSRYSALLSSA